MTEARDAIGRWAATLRSSSATPAAKKAAKKGLLKASLKRKVGTGWDFSVLDLAFRSSEPRDTDGRWESSHAKQVLGRSMSDGEKALSEAKNEMAKAMLGKNPRKIKKAEKKLAAAKFKRQQETNRDAALGRAGAAYSSPGSIAARQNYSKYLAANR